VPEAYKIVKMYLHGNKSENWCQGGEIFLAGPAREKFCYALYEVEFEAKVNLLTGETTILKVTSGNQVLVPKEAD